MLFDGEWKPFFTDGYYLCRFYADETRYVFQQPYFIGKDKTPLKFYNVKSAQLKCDALNRRNNIPH